MKNSNQPGVPVNIKINQKWCKKCGICIAFCPKKVFVANDFGLPLVKNPEQCIRCMLCVVRCPDFAVDVECKDEGTDKKISGM